MAKRQSFADKASKKVHTRTCPVCQSEIQFIKLCKADKNGGSNYKFRSVNVGVCKCNEKEIYG